MKTILHVEDDPSVRAALSIMLHDYGYRIISAESIRDAKRDLESNQFNLIICDGTLDPRRAHDGVHFANLMNRRCKVLVLSGDQYALTLAEGFGLPCLPKHVPSQKLKETITQLLS